MKKKLSLEELEEIKEIEKLSRENKDNIVDYSKELSKVIDFIECPKCKYKNILGSSKCAKCGYDFKSSIKSCPNCAKYNKIDADKCSCGYSFIKKKNVINNFFITLFIIVIIVFLFINYIGIIDVDNKYICYGIGGLCLLILLLSYIIYGYKYKIPLDADMKIRENYTIGRTISKVIIVLGFIIALCILGYVYYKNK